MKTYFLTALLFLIPLYLFAQTPSGWLKLEFNTDSAYVVLGSNLFDANKVASGDSLEFDAGVRLISLQTHFDKSKSLFIRIFKDSTVTYSYTFNKSDFSPATITSNIAARHYYDANVMVLSDEDSDIFYNGEYKGTGFAKFNTFGDIGELEIENPDFGRTKRRLNVPEQRVNFIASDLRPVKSVSLLYSIFPGASQLYKRQYLKAFLFGASAITMFSSAGAKSSQYHNELDVFYEYQEDYDNARNEQEALRLGDLAESQQNKVQRLDNHRKVLLLSGLLIYGYNIYDAFTSQPTGGYAKNEKDLEFYLSQEEISGFINTSGTIRYNF